MMMLAISAPDIISRFPDLARHLHQPLEDAATEFQAQGLELDWVCMTWDADLRFAQSGWSYNAFCGSQWTSVRKPDRQQHLRNAYRVLLTRARQGIIFAPPGDPLDVTSRGSGYITGIPRHDRYPNVES